MALQDLDDRSSATPIAEQAIIDVVVPVYNKRRFLESSLRSILDAAEASRIARVTVVDHGSTDGSLELGASLCEGRARHRVLRGGTIAALRNRGADEADRPILSFIDCDCVVPLDYFTTLRQVMARSDIGATGCRVDYPTDGPWVERTWHALHRTGAKNGFRAYLNSGNFAVRRSAFTEIGGFDESLVTGEDAKIGQRLNAGGHKVWESLDLVVVHLDNPHTLRSFFKKEVWHAQGMFGTVRAWPPDLPTLMTVVHAIALASALCYLAAANGGPVLRLVVALVLALAVPVLAVVYRAISRRRMMPWPTAVLLYETYFLARITALAQIGLRALRGSGTDDERTANG